MRAPRTDLAWAAALAPLCVGLVLLVPDSAPAVRLVAGALLLLALPGWALTGALLPGTPLSGAERVALGAGLSLAVCVLTALALYAVGISLSATAWAVTLATFTLVAALAGAARDGARPLRMRVALAGAARGVAVAAALALLVAAGVVGFRPLGAPGDLQGTTALWMLPSGPGRVAVGVASGQVRDASYVVEIQAAGATARRLGPIDLAPGERWSRSVPVPAGNPRVTATLRTTAMPEAVIRRVALRRDRSAPAPVPARAPLPTCRRPHPLASRKGCYRVVLRGSRAYRFYASGRIVPIRSR